MPRSIGHWLDPITVESHLVTTHQQWLLDNASSYGLKEVVAGLDPNRDEDEIRMIGVQAGLVRVRDYGTRMSIQFFVSDPLLVQRVLWVVRGFMRQQEVGPFKMVWVNNLFSGEQTTMLASEFMEPAEGDRAI